MDTLKFNLAANITLAHQAEIEAARTAYEGLTDAQKAFVSEEMKERLDAVYSNIVRLSETLFLPF